jgi:hypothetical protein
MQAQVQEQWRVIHPDEREDQDQVIMQALGDGGACLFVSQPPDEVVLLRYGSDGALRWQTSRRIPGRKIETRNVCVDNERSIYTIVWATAGGIASFVISKYDSTGNEVWSSSFPGPGVKLSHSGTGGGIIAADADLNVHVAGSVVQRTAQTIGDYLTDMYDTQGKLGGGL